MVASPAVPGLVFCFAATVLLIIASVSAPVWNEVSFLNVGVAPNELRYGVFGYTGSKVAIGYDFVGTSGSDDSVVVVHSVLTKVLILHPIAAGLSGLAFLFGVCGAGYHRAGTVLMTLVSALAALATLVIFVIDLVLFGITRNRFRDQGIPAEYGIANWVTAGALVALLLGFLAACCGSFGRYKAKRKDTY